MMTPPGNDILSFQRIAKYAFFALGAYFILHFAYIAEGQSANAHGQEPTYKYDTHGIKLEGRLIQRTFYGPPGFGETPTKDAREKVFVLVLPRPIRVEPAEHPQPEDIAKNIRQIQLLILPREKGDAAAKLLGKAIVVTGALNEATAPSEHLKVSMTVETIVARD